MKILARHLTIDMYKCKPSCFDNTEQLLDRIRELMEESKFTVLSSLRQEMPDGHIAIMVLFSEGHMTFHAYPQLKYISADTFLCQQNASPELLFTTFRKIFKPEKTKTTLLRRGDFGSVADMKPRYNTRTAPLRKIRNTGSKVMRILTRRRDS